MRMLRKMGLLLAAMGLPASLNAQPGKYSATIIISEIEMRAGPSWQFPPTGKLKKGEQVIVHHEDSGWAAIVPSPESTSWINHRFLGEFDPNGTGKQNALIMADNVEVRVGSDKGVPLGVTQVKLPRGTWVEVNGAKVRDDNSIWHPITPPEGEYRWLPKEALGAPAPLTPPPVFVKSNGNAPVELASSDKTPGGLTASGGKSPAPVQHPQWDKAEQAERSGDYTTAEKLYTLVYQDLRQKGADAEAVLVCYNRIIKCQDRLRLDASTPRANFTPPALPDGARPPAALQAPSGSSGGAVGVAWPGNSVASNLTSTGPGKLRRTFFEIDGKQAYALDNANGQLMYYVTAGSGVALDAYVNRQVELRGAAKVRGDIRGGQYMVVSQVNPLR